MFIISFISITITNKMLFKFWTSIKNLLRNAQLSSLKEVIFKIAMKREKNLNFGCKNITPLFIDLFLIMRFKCSFSHGSELTRTFTQIGQTLFLIKTPCRAPGKLLIQTFGEQSNNQKYESYTTNTISNQITKASTQEHT